MDTLLTTETEVRTLAYLLESAERPKLNQLPQQSHFIALDTERAGAYRYDDRAFVLQLHHPAVGSVLIDAEAFAHTEVSHPETSHAESTNTQITRTYPGLKTLWDSIADLPWVLHDATTDLPALTALGAHPTQVFDTRIAAQLASFPQNNLRYLVEKLVGVTLHKTHGREDWSIRPLPEDWVQYAIDNVRFLGQLAANLQDILAEQDRLNWFWQECDHLLQQFTTTSMPLINEDWRNIKGAGRIKNPRSQAVATALFEHRNSVAARFDISPTSVLPHHTILDLAAKPPTTARFTSVIVRGAAKRLPQDIQQTVAEREKSRGFRLPSPRSWHQVISQALEEYDQRQQSSHNSDANDVPVKSPSKTPTKYLHPRHQGAVESQTEQLITALHTVAEYFQLDPASLATTKVLRELAWLIVENQESEVRKPCRHITTGQIHAWLRDLGLRPWQAEVLASNFYFAVSYPATGSDPA